MEASLQLDPEITPDEAERLGGAEVGVVSMAFRKHARLWTKREFHAHLACPHWVVRARAMLGLSRSPFILRPTAPYPCRRRQAKVAHHLARHQATGKQFRMDHQSVASQRFPKLSGTDLSIGQCSFHRGVNRATTEEPHRWMGYEFRAAIENSGEV